MGVAELAGLEASLEHRDRNHGAAGDRPGRHAKTDRLERARLLRPAANDSGSLEPVEAAKIEANPRNGSRDRRGDTSPESEDRVVRDHDPERGEYTGPVVPVVPVHGVDGVHGAVVAHDVEVEVGIGALVVSAHGRRQLGVLLDFSLDQIQRLE